MTPSSYEVYLVVATSFVGRGTEPIFPLFGMHVGVCVSVYVHTCVHTLMYVYGVY